MLKGFPNGKYFWKKGDVVEITLDTENLKMKCVNWTNFRNPKSQEIDISLPTFGAVVNSFRIFGISKYSGNLKFVPTRYENYVIYHF